MKKAMLKKAAITSMAVLTLVGGGTSAFADSKGKGNDNSGNYQKDKDDKGKKDKNKIHLQFKDEKELKWALSILFVLHRRAFLQVMRMGRSSRSKRSLELNRSWRLFV